jgi:hypothetical protein
LLAEMGDLPTSNTDVILAQARIHWSKTAFGGAWMLAFASMTVKISASGFLEFEC